MTLICINLVKNAGTAHGYTVLSSNTNIEFAHTFL